MFIRIKAKLCWLGCSMQLMGRARSPAVTSATSRCTACCSDAFLILIHTYVTRPCSHVHQVWLMLQPPACVANVLRSPKHVPCRPLPPRMHAQGKQTCTASNTQKSHTNTHTKKNRAPSNTHTHTRNRTPTHSPLSTNKSFYR